MLNMYKTRYCNVINDPYLVLILTVTFDLKLKKKKKGNKKNKKRIIIILKRHLGNYWN